MNKKLCSLLLLLSLFLSSCSKEPVIELSEENQKKIEQHIAIQNNPDLSQELAEDESSQEDESEPHDQEPNQSDELALPDFSQFDQVESVQATISDYLPSNSYQLKEFNHGGELIRVYTDYLDESMMKIQLSYLNKDGVSHEVYDWSDGSMRLVYNQNGGVNLFNNLNSQNSTTGPVIVLALPFSKGNKWQSRPGEESEITAIYSSFDLSGVTYENVIEVTTSGENFNYREYWAQGEGIVARWNNYLANDQKDFCQIIHNDRDVMQLIDLTVYKPTTGSDLVEKETGQLAWQTNMNRGEAFEELFHNQGLIGEDIMVNGIHLLDNRVEVDFSSGVVASIGENKAPETAVIAAIISTIGDFFNCDEVVLTVDGLIMAPDSFQYPVDGVYNVDLNYLKDPQKLDQLEESTDQDQNVQEIEESSPEENSIPE